MSLSTQATIDTIDKYSAHYYERFDGVVFGEGAKGVWVVTKEGKKVLDMFGDYSAVSLGHNHPEIKRVLAKNFAMVSREYYTEQEAGFLEALCRISGMEAGAVAPINPGAEAVETAIKLVRMWARRRKGIALWDTPEIIFAENAFHGRTFAALSASSTAHYRDGFGPFLPGFFQVPYGSVEAIERAIRPHTAAVLLEPIQGEAGIIVPPKGYLAQVQEICRRNNVLLVFDEVQTGLGRTGKMFCFEHEGVRPDVLVVAKALGGGQIPISATLAPREIMDVLNTGTHGSTFGGNAFACAAGEKTIEILEREVRGETLVERSARLGSYLSGELGKIRSPLIKEVRGPGLFIGVELVEEAGNLRAWREELFGQGVMLGQSRNRTLRLTPPLIIRKKEIDLFLSTFEDVVKKFSRK